MYNRVQFRMTDVRKLINSKDDSYVITGIAGIVEARLRLIDGIRCIIVLYNGAKEYKAYALKENYELNKFLCQQITEEAKKHIDEPAYTNVPISFSMKDKDEYWQPVTSDTEDELTKAISLLKRNNYHVIKPNMKLESEEILPNGNKKTVYSARLTPCEKYLEALK